MQNTVFGHHLEHRGFTEVAVTSTGRLGMPQGLVSHSYAYRQHD